MKYKKKTEFLRCRRAQDMLDPRQELLQRFPLERPQKILCKRRDMTV